MEECLANFTFQFENKIRREEQENSSEIQRLQIDIEHLCLGLADGRLLPPSLPVGFLRGPAFPGTGRGVGTGLRIAHVPRRMGHLRGKGYVRMNLSIERREEIGRRCKLLLDIARIRCLATAGLDARLVYFVDRNVTPENVAIVAVPRTPTPC
ncbi:hypothetical protein HPB47_021214 [Ixodes persulcatus]|uniref:Uncharacterized protein n=1 Tax=Ixodes persulcatus TaxID=34615 RepID=A0AC60QD98_IXOPE|nr:hypothetical protein HPB47_021214 [Ixodes persulcatus]